MSRLLKQQTGGIVEIFIILVICGSVHGTFQDCLPLMNVIIRRNPSRGSGTLVCLVSMHNCKEKKKKKRVMQKMWLLLPLLPPLLPALHLRECVYVCYELSAEGALIISLLA